jgi:hypothetical protein
MKVAHAAQALCYGTHRDFTQGWVIEPLCCSDEPAALVFT